MSAPLTIRELLAVYVADLTTWGATVNTTVRFARDPMEPVEIVIGLKPGHAVAVVTWQGDQELGGNILCPLARATFDVIVGRKRSLGKDRDAKMLDAAPEPEEPDTNAPPEEPAPPIPVTPAPTLLDLVDNCRQQVLSLRLPSDIVRAGFARYAGCQPVSTPDGIPLQAYKLSFAIDTQIATIAARDYPPVTP